ncbi:MAG: extracellular solute-binding protein [Actinobacteria bacterium]|nr:extracellular solute-binding protein [Actinomycetota bacterium]
MTAGVALAALMLSGCAGGAASGGDGKASLELQSAMEATTPQYKALDSISKAYEKEHPGVTIKVVPQGKDYEGDMKVRMAAGDLPDIWATHGWSLLRYSEFLEPLQTQPWAKRVNPVLDATMKNSKGEFFALPVTTDVAGIVYNKAVLDKLGIDPKSLGTMSAFEGALAKIKAAGVVPITSSSKASWFAGDLADWLGSGSFTKDQLAKLAKGDFVDSGFSALYGKLEDWTKKGYFNADFAAASSDDVPAALAQGTTAFVMVQNGIAVTARELVPDVQLGFIPVPAINGDPEYLIGGEGFAFGAWKDGKNKKTALDFLNFMAQSKNVQTLASAGGNPAGLKDVKVDLGPLTPSFDAFFTPGKVRMVPYFDRAYLPNGMWDTLITTTGGVITGQTDVPGAVKQAGADFKTLFGQK